MKSVMLSPARVSREIDRLFEDFFRSPVLRSDVDSDFVPRANITDAEDSVVLTFELPGMEKNDIKVTVKDSVLTVSGERKSELEDKSRNYIRREIAYGSFFRSFTLPDTVNPDKISADYKNGMLEITLGKLEKVKPKEIEIKVS